MRNSFLLILISLLYFSGNAQQYAWAKQFQTLTTSSGIGEAITLDAAGNVYSTGYFNGTMDFDPGPGVFYMSSPSTSNRDTYVSKLDRNGNFVWAASFTGFGGPIGYGIAVDDSGYVYVTGYFVGTVDFDPGPGVVNLTSYFQVESDPFICKLSPAGGFVWVKTFKETEDNSGTGIAVDENGNVYISLYSHAGEDIDPGPGIVSVTWGSYVLKLDRNGNYVAHASLGGGSTSYPYNLCLKNGFLYTSIRVGVSPIVSKPTKLDTALNVIWQVDQGANTDVKSITADDAGNVIIAGQYTGTVDFDPGIGVDNRTSVGLNDIYIVKLDANGNFKWAHTAGASNNEFASSVSTGPEGDIYVTGMISVPTYLETGNPASYLVPQGTDFFEAKFNSNGNFQWAFNIGGTSSDYGNALITDNDGNTYTTGYFMLSPDFNPDPGVTDTLSTNASGAIYVCKYSAANKITGNIFSDANNDGIRQLNEINVPYVLVKAVNGASTTYGITDSAGRYNIYIGSGSYTISTIHTPPYYTSAVATHTASFSTSASGIDSLNDFPVHAITGINDLSINCYSLSAARPGRDFYMGVIYRNTGTTTLSGTVTLQHDASVTYQQSVPAASSYSTPNISWNYTNLRPFETRSIRVLFRTSVNANAGSTILHQTAIINPIVNDSTPTNNTDVNHSMVVASYDPNVKTVTPEGPVSLQFIGADSTYLSYCVRFQNTGTDTAFVVVVLDTIQNTLDLTSLKILGASHPFSVEIKPANVLKFTFNNILLPDSTTNEPLSHGYISYTLKPLNNLIAGTGIKNKAGIYFDFNDDVITNETINLVSSIVPVGLSQFNIETSDCKEVMLSWTTETETDNSMFAVERSNDGSKWTTITQINGAGNSLVTKSYSYTDKTRVNGTVYYRLKQINGNGGSSYSFVQRVSCNVSSQVKIYPNPVTDHLFIEAGSAFDYSLFDTKGALIKKGKSLQPNYTFNTQTLNKGVYILILNTEEGVSQHKMLVR